MPTAADLDPAPATLATDDATAERQASAAWVALGTTTAGRRARRAVAALLVALADGAIAAPVDGGDA